MPAARTVLRGIFKAEDYNAMRRRLPRSIRRDIETAPTGHVGLVVEIVTTDDCRLMTVYNHVPADADLTHAMAHLESVAHHRLR
jgi:hypothetical protein